jgi:hypothetical protein
MSHPRRKIADLPLVISDGKLKDSLSDAPNILEIEMYYNIGGTNCFTHKREERGIYISVSPMRISGGFRTFSAFSGMKSNVMALKRFSKKALADAQVDRYLFSQMVNAVLAKNHVNLTPEGNEKFKELLLDMPVSESQVA